VSPSPLSPKINAPPPERRSGIWIVINLLLAGAAVYILYRRQHAPAEAPPPIPAPVLVSTPAPAPSAAVETPKPIPTARPAPVAAATPEAPIVLSSVDRRALPRQVILTKPVDFILLSDGKQVGSIHAAAGVQVDLVDVASDGEIEVQMGGVRQTIPAADTDVESRVRTLLKYR
jgi:hypothetical protein